jgi:hypothetical protein
MRLPLRVGQILLLWVGFVQPLSCYRERKADSSSLKRIRNDKGEYLAGLRSAGQTRRLPLRGSSTYCAAPEGLSSHFRAREVEKQIPHR